MKPGTGSVSVLLVGRLILRELSFWRAIANTRAKLTTTPQRTVVIVFTVSKDSELKQPSKAYQTRMDHTPWAVLNEFDLATVTLKWNCAYVSERGCRALAPGL